MPGNEGHALNPERHHTHDVSARALHGDTRSQPGQSLVVESAERQGPGIDAHGQHKIRSLVEEAEACRHDADHDARARVDGDVSADDRRISSESTSPVAVHEHDRLG